ncbi:hypothetical protein PIB30_020977 [Stylosanthes scabra]|uniref:Uncharacterized protein n=1 Tax=Stylosanthes scabra TaxID=79078 RepID=A0ABU6SA24_9FABA|nr:hypothetical protein [Stylosanthes scabra]
MNESKKIDQVEKIDESRGHLTDQVTQLEGLYMEKSKSYPEYSEFGYRERSNSYNFNGPYQKGSDAELKRKKRIKSYNVYAVETKLKTSVRNSFKWIKNKFGEW